MFGAAIGAGASLIGGLFGGGDDAPPPPTPAEIAASRSQAYQAQSGAFNEQQLINQQAAYQGSLGMMEGGLDRQLALQRRADPAYAGIKDAYASRIAGDLALGNQMSPEQLRQTQQATRAAQASRGGAMLGNAPVGEEAIRTFLAGNQLQRERQQAASQYLEGSAGLQGRSVFQNAQAQAYQPNAMRMFEGEGQAGANYRAQAANYVDPLSAGVAGVTNAANIWQNRNQRPQTTQTTSAGGYSPFNAGGNTGGSLDYLKF